MSNEDKRILITGAIMSAVGALLMWMAMVVKLKQLLPPDVFDTIF